jgi:CBS domain containing-hemolysin-like protein
VPSHGRRDEPILADDAHDRGATAIDAALGLGAVLLLILAHGFFVAGEFSLVAADRSKIEALAAEGSRPARSTLEAVRTLSFQLSGAQLGITVTSLIVGFIAEPTIGDPLEPLVRELGLARGTSHGIAVAAALLIATALEMVVGELVPQNLGIAEPVAVAFRVATPLRLYNRVLRVIIVVLNNAANGTVRLLGIEPREELTAVRSVDELQMLVHSSRAEGLLPEEEFSLLSRSLSFGGKTASDALVPRTSVDAICRDGTLGDLARLAVETGHSRFPVYGADLDDVVGVAHVKNSYGFPFAERASRPVTDAMRDAMVVPESHQLEPLLVEMRRRQQHLAVVLDEYGGTAGLITLEDLLEEIVGDIEDEYDPAGAQLTAPPSGVHLVSGMLHPDEVFEATGLAIPEGDYETIAGFVLSLLDRIPQLGDHASYDGWELKVVEMDRRRVAQVLLVAPPTPAAEEAP